MKVFFIDNALTHYYNQVLNKLNCVPGIELVVVVPSDTSAHVGEGVYQTKKGIDFRICELEEYSRFQGEYTSFRGLRELILKERPDVIIVGEFHLLMFIFNLPVVMAMKQLKVKLVLKAIPFRIPTFDEAIGDLGKGTRSVDRLSRPLAAGIRALGLERLARIAYLYMRKYAFNLVDAHIDYTDDAYRVFGSYGVSRERIFISGNSPDTDKLVAIKESLEGVAPILPPSDHRLIHVGRLVEWKRVDLLIRALGRVKHQFPDAELVVAGYGPQEQALKQLAGDLGLEGSVRFVGGIYDPVELGKYFMASSVYVLAGMGGLSINDAMCFGLPVICSVCDGTEKRLVRDGHNGWFFRDGDEQDLADKIATVLVDPERRRQMGENSTRIIRDEVNIHTVIKGFTEALAYVSGSR